MDLCGQSRTINNKNNYQANHWFNLKCPNEFTLPGHYRWSIIQVLTESAWCVLRINTTILCSDNLLWSLIGDDIGVSLTTVAPSVDDNTVEHIFEHDHLNSLYIHPQTVYIFDVWCFSWFACRWSVNAGLVLVCSLLNAARLRHPTSVWWLWCGALRMLASRKVGSYIICCTKRKNVAFVEVDVADSQTNYVSETWAGRNAERSEPNIGWTRTDFNGALSEDHRKRWSMSGAQRGGLHSGNGVGSELNWALEKPLSSHRNRWFRTVILNLSLTYLVLRASF